MQTAIHNTNILHKAEVGQFAKMPCPTLKALPTNGLEVRQLQNPLRTYAPTQESNSKDFDLSQNFDLKKLNDFTTLIKTLYPCYNVAFSPHPYLKNHFTNCRKQALDLFLNLVETFTLLHHQQRTTAVENVLAATANDYTEAYKLWLVCQPVKKQVVFLPTQERVLNFIKYRYTDKPFTINKIAAQLNYSAHYIGKIFAELLTKKQIELIHSPKVGTKIYQTCNQ